MIIRGEPIHCDGHGECGLFLIPTFLYSPAVLAASPSFFCPDLSRPYVLRCLGASFSPRKGIIERRSL